MNTQPLTFQMKRRRIFSRHWMLPSLLAGVSLIIFSLVYPIGILAIGAAILGLLFFGLFAYLLVGIIREADGTIVASIFVAVSLTIAISYIHLRATSPLFNLFFSPADLYKNLSEEEEFDLSKPGYLREMAFTVKYPGKHWITILTEKPLNGLEYYDSNFKVKVTIKDNNKVISESISSDTRPWFHGGPGIDGFALKLYSAPIDLPIGRPLLARVEVIEPSETFTKKYGKQRIVVGKDSDE